MRFTMLGTDMTVLYKFKSEATPEQREYVKALIKELPSKISALQTVVTGEKIAQPLDHDYDMGMFILAEVRGPRRRVLGAIFLFESKDKLAEFRPHQAHTDYRALSAPYLEGACISSLIGFKDYIVK